MKKVVSILIILSVVFSVSSCIDNGKSRFEFSDVSIKDMYETSEPISTSFLPRRQNLYLTGPIGPVGILHNFDAVSEHYIMPIDNVKITLYFSFNLSAAYISGYCIDAYEGDKTVTVADHNDGPYYVDDFGYSIGNDGKMKYEHFETVTVPAEFFNDSVGKISFKIYLPLLHEEACNLAFYYRTDGESVVFTEKNPEFGSAWVKPIYNDFYEIPANNRTEYEEKYDIKKKYIYLNGRWGIDVFDDIECFDAICFELKTVVLDGDDIVSKGYCVAACAIDSLGRLTVRLYSYEPDNGKLSITESVSLNYSGEYSLEFYANTKLNEKHDDIGFHLFLWDEGTVLSFNINPGICLSKVGEIMDVKENGETRDSMLEDALSPKSAGGYTFTPEKTIFGFSKFEIQKSEDQ